MIGCSHELPALPCRGWCILTTSPGATIALAKSLTDAGFDAWTPIETVRPEPPKVEPWEKVRPQPRRKQPDFVTRPMLPTFVFAPADRLEALTILSRSPALTYHVWDTDLRRMVTKGHPFFRIFPGSPIVPDAALAPLRRIEGRRRKPRGKVRPFNPGDAVRLTEGAYEGLRGNVVRTEGKMTVVRFQGGIHEPKIHTWLLIPDLDGAREIHQNPSQAERRVGRAA